MIILDSYKGKKVGVFGLGRAGKAAVDALLAGGAEVYAWDDLAVSREALKHQMPEQLHLLAPVKWPWEEMVILVLSPGIPLTHPRPHDVVQLAKQAHCPVIGDVDLLYQACPHATYIAITGTNGKSTTTALIGHILKEAGKVVEVGGNIGTAALSLRPLTQHEIYVLELSSYQLDLVATTRFDVAVLLNLTPDHLDRHGDMQGYQAAKCHIFDRQTENDVAIIAVDDRHTQNIADTCEQQMRSKIIRVSAYGNQGAINFNAGILHDSATGISVDLSHVKSLQGQHNGQNAAVAYAACQAIGIIPEDIGKAMKSFPGLAHRMEWVGEKGGVNFINDSKATNADATMHALKSFENIYWIVGGKAKSGGIEPLSEFFLRIKKAYLIGEAADAFAGTLQGKLDYLKSGAMHSAVEQAFLDAAESGEPSVVLLSPACASFDQYANFEQRGDHFKQLVKGML